MKDVLQTHSLSWAESIRLALLAEGIEAVILDQQSLGYLGFAGRVRVAVVTDSDLPRAREVVRHLEPGRSPLPPSWRWQRNVYVLFGAAFVLLSVATAWAAPRPIAILLALSVLGLLAGGVAMLLRGKRAGRGRPTDPEERPPTT